MLFGVLQTTRLPDHINNTCTAMCVGCFGVDETTPSGFVEVYSIT